MNKENQFDVCIIGLGYVGLTLGTALANAGLRVFGVERLSQVVEMTNKGQPHFSETGLKQVLSKVVQNNRFVASTQLDSSIQCQIYIITVGTPLDANGKARLDMIESATLEVANHMQDDALVILRSTVKIETCRKIVKPILEASKKKFEIAMCPERTLEGKALQELRQLPQIVGADQPKTRERASQLFKKLTNTIIQVSSLEAAEIIKLVDNTFRDLRFAFANEVARVCDAFGVNGYEVIQLGKLGYERTDVPSPGLVGGPCLEKDPHILCQSALSKGIELELTKAGRTVNERQPFETVKLIDSELNRREFSPDSKIAVLGVAFKGQPETDDMRGSMTLKVLEALKQTRPQACIHLFDPVVDQNHMKNAFPAYTIANNYLEAIKDAALVLITNNHPHWTKHEPAFLYENMKERGFIYDYWNFFSNLPQSELKNSYFAVGNTGVKNEST